uniref:Integrase catalytic domain-containing protein n=1 Tax=Nicotiana tabacum TaxID=4097 RepID=A0A1S3ZWF9_TOBAC|nr:PREDICTED: uncharacterized protein LOC107791253 [Nicotiana tabacum]
MSNKMYTGGYNGGGQSNVSSNNSNGSYKPRNTAGKSTVWCDYCKYKGHTRENCFKFHGYPSDFKNKRRGGAPHAQANSAINSSCSEPQVQGQQVTTTPSPAHFFTQEQYQQIMHLLNKDMEVESVANGVAAGPTGTAHAFMTNLVHNNWIIDTCSTNHMVHSLNLLETYDEILDNARSKVHLPTREHVSITHVGICSFFKNKKVQNIFHILEFKYNLLSVSKLTKELRYLVAIYPDFCVFQELSSGKVLGIGKEALGLYILKVDDRQVLNQQASSSLVSLSTSTVNTISDDINKGNNLTENKSCPVFSLWHKRLGHSPLKVLRSVKYLHDMHFKQHHCTACHVAKQSRLPFPVSSSYSKSIFDMVHGDIWGPYRVPTHDGKRYILTLVDDYSKYTWLFLLHSKSDTNEVLKNFVELIYTQFDSKLKCLRTENGIEFFNDQLQTLLKKQGIVHQTSCIYTPQQNGTVERKHRSILDMARALRFQAHLPLSSASLFPLPSPVPSPTTTCESSALSVPLRKSSRLTKPPVWLTDYVVPSKKSVCSYPMINHMAYDKLSPSCRSSLTAFSAIVEPKSFAEASQDLKWIEAMKAKITALEENKTWSIIPLPLGKFSIGCKWVFKVKYKSSVELERYKSRLVAKGYSQQKGLDYTETFSPVAKMVTIRAIVALAVAFGWYVFHMDVHNTFFQGDLLEEVYIHVLDSFSSEGECQQKIASDLVVILVYVDDLQVTGSYMTLIKQVRKRLQERKYALELVSELGLAGGKTATTPLEFNHTLTSIEFDKEVPNDNTTEDKELEEKGSY